MCRNNYSCRFEEERNALQEKEQAIADAQAALQVLYNVNLTYFYLKIASKFYFVLYDVLGVVRACQDNHVL